MDLKSGALFWPQVLRERFVCPPLQGSTRCDVVIIGAGLSGAMIAHRLSQEGMDILVLDKRGVGEGSTSASTALVLYEIDTLLIDLMQQRGHTDAIASYHRCLTAIDELACLTQRLGGRCAFRARPSLYLASQPTDLSKLTKEFHARKRAGFEVQFLSQSTVEKWFSFSAPGALYSANAAEVDPVRLTIRLLKESARHGARIFTRTEATSMTEDRYGTMVQTSTGHRIEARWIVVAAGFETAARAIRRVVRLKSTYALVTRPVRGFPGWRDRCLIWEMKRPYIYLRTTADKRIMIGGEDEDFVDAQRRDRLLGKKRAILSQKLKRLFPEIRCQPACAWAGTFGETKDGLPYIGQLASHRRILYALCYGANGTTFAVIAAELIRDAIKQRRNPHARLFRFGR